ncbi:MAG: serine hydrolase [Clostridia bacterium]|nr:serine hydrolase [Clostridia bacterium]
MSILNINRSLTLAGRIFDVTKPTKPLIELPHGKPALPVRHSAQPLSRCTPEEVGVPSSAVLELARALKDNDEVNAHSVMLLRNGRVFFEHAFGMREINCPGYVFSCSKSFVSLAVGMLCDEGKLSLDENIEKIFPDKVGKLAKLSPRVVTVRDLLTMKSGVSFNEAECMATEEWIKEFITSAALGENGREFFYNSLNTYMLAAICTQKCGTDLMTYLQARLFEPLGITDVYWEKGPEGIEKGGWGLYIRPEDMAKVGIMLLDGGTYLDRRIISSEYLAEATAAHSIAPASFGAFNYGYQLWVGRERDTVLFNGMLGQNMHIDRENGIICVTYAGNSDSFQQSAVFEYIDRYLCKDFPAILPPSKRDLRMLEDFKKPQQSILSRVKHLLKPDALPKECALLDGRSYEAEKGGCVGFFPFLAQTVFNNYASGLDRISFEMSDGTFFLKYREHEATFTIPLGFDSPKKCTLNIGGDVFRAKAKARFTKDMRGRTELEIMCDFTELPFTRFIKISLTHSGIRMVQSELPGKGLISSVLRSQAEERPDNVVFTSLLDKTDSEAFEYKFDRLFEPTVELKETSK